MALCRYDTVLHFHQQHALHRLIDAVDGQLTLLQGLFQSGNYLRDLADGEWALYKIIPGYDRQYRRLGQ